MMKNEIIKNSHPKEGKKREKEHGVSETNREHVEKSPTPCSGIGGVSRVLGRRFSSRPGTVG